MCDMFLPAINTGLGEPMEDACRWYIKSFAEIVIKLTEYGVKSVLKFAQAKENFSRPKCCLHPALFH